MKTQSKGYNFSQLSNMAFFRVDQDSFNCVFIWTVNDRNRAVWILSRPPSEFNFDTRLRNIITINGRRRDGSRWPGQKRTRAGINARQLRTMVVTAPREPRGIYRTDHRRGKKVGINGGRVQYENKTLLKKPPALTRTPRCPGNEKCCQQQNLYGASALRISQCYRVDRARIEPFLRHIHWSFLCRPML